MDWCNSLNQFILTQLSDPEIALKDVINTFNIPIVILNQKLLIVDINMNMENITALKSSVVRNWHYAALSRELKNETKEFYTLEHFTQEPELNENFINSLGETYGLYWKCFSLANTLYSSYLIMVGKVLYKKAAVVEKADKLSKFAEVVKNTALYLQGDNNQQLTPNHYELLSQLLHQLPGCTFIKDRNFQYLDGNQYMLDIICGFAEKTDLIGKDDYALNRLLGKRWPDDLYRSIRKDDTYVIEQGQYITGKKETPLLGTDGRVIVQSSSKIPLLSDSGKIMGLYGISLDISSTLNPISLYSLYQKLSPTKKIAHENFLKHVLKVNDNDALQTLTSSELICALYFTLGLTIKEVAQKINLSPRTIEVHLARVKEKLGFQSKSQLVQLFSNKVLYSDAGLI
jgi:DNA-binding CsgD family transcriptional regulator